MSVTAEVASKEARVRVPESTPAAEVEQLRNELERIDAAIVEAVARRCEVARRIGEAKRAAGLAVMDPVREAGVVRRAVERARHAGLHDEGVRQLYWVLIDMARRTQIDERGDGSSQIAGCAVGASR